MSDSDSDEGDIPPGARLPLAVALVVLFAGLAVYELARARVSSADEVVSGALVGEPGHEQLLLTLSYTHSGEDTSYEYKLAFFDPATGALARSEVLSGHSDATRAYGVLAAAGPYYWLKDRAGITLRDARDPKVVVTLEALAARHPDILGPWHQSLVQPTGTLAVESDDKHWYALDPRTDRVAPLAYAPYAPNDPFVTCYAQGWQRPGELLAFAEQPTQRYSQKVAFALCRTPQIDYGKVIDPKPVGEARFDYPSFACDPESGQPVTFVSPESALFHATEGDHQLWARIRPDASLVWSHPLPPAPKGEQGPGPGQAFRVGEWVLLVRGTKLSALGAEDGRLLWEKAL